MKMERWLRRVSFASMLGMFLILLMGSLVTKTESGRGCGDDWPLCNGKFIPAYTIESMIEYSHRAVTGVVGLILLAATILVLRYSKRVDAKWYVGGAMFFTFLQAVLGAMAVMWPQSSAVMALHFGFSLLSFAFTLLLWLAFTRFGDAMLRGDGTKLTKGVRRAVWLILVYSYVVVYLGAFVRHTDSSGGCVGWPLCNGQVIPELTGATGIVFAHRIGAALFGIGMLLLFLAIRRQSEAGSGMYRASRIAFILTVLQILSGGFVTFAMGNSNAYLIASMLHTLIISALFGILCYLVIASLKTAPQEQIRAYTATRLP